MSQDAVERLLGRLITDAHFREMAAVSFPLVCRQTGFQVSATEMDLLSCLDLEWFAEISLRIDRGLCRAGTKD